MKPSEFFISKEVAISSIFALFNVILTALWVALLPSDVGTLVVCFFMFLTSLITIIGAKLASFKVTKYIYDRTRDYDA